MSLDKWINPAEKEGKKKKKEEKKRQQAFKVIQSEEKINRVEKNLEPITQKIKKYHLKCSKKGCNYQKTIVKKELNERDMNCPRCKSSMKVK